MSEYLKDSQFEEVKIESVRKESDGWSFRREDGWSFYVPPFSTVEPKAGMTARFYGKGVGYPVRGLFLDGVKVYYRTEAEDEEHREIEMYGADAKDWLARWDAGQSVWSIEMGGLGPGYEQAIQVTVAEILRHMLGQNYEAAFWEDEEIWKRDREEIRQASFKNKVIDSLGLSGAQFGAAMSVATYLYRNGPRKMMADKQVKDRHIQVSKNFPGSVAA